MITDLSIENFKCFNEKKDFKFSSLNLLTGYNGRGKSSVIQGLLLLAQSMKRDSEMKFLFLKGNFIDLDLFEDILCDESKPISFIVTSNNSNIQKLQLNYEKNPENERIGRLENILIDGKSLLTSTGSIKDSKIDHTKQFDRIPVEEISSIFNNFYYISADRLGPTKYEEKTEIPKINPVGTNGQYLLNVLNKNPQLKTEICNNIQYIMDSNDELEIYGSQNDYSVLSLRFTNSKKKIKPFNTGFGYTYILSIILLINYVSEGCIFIENPEAHLHPLAQSRLMELISKKIISNKRLQIFIETHSEHIINSVRLQIAKKNIDINSNDVSIYFFDKNFEIKFLEINPKGQILKWPVGFFDQQTKDLQEILKIGLIDES